MGKIIFYWHKHPNGTAYSSQGDEDETYDAFMDSTGSKRMAFLVTAEKNGVITQDCRIEIRKPIVGTLESEMFCEEETTVAKYCEKIIKDKIVEPKKNTIIYSNQHTKSYNQTFYNKNQTVQKSLNEICDNIKIGNDKKSIILKSKNDLVNENLQITLSNGMATIICYTELKEFLETFLENIKDILSCPPIIKDNGNITRFNIVPKKGMHEKLKKSMKELYKDIQEIIEKVENYCQDDYNEELEDQDKKVMNSSFEGIHSKKVAY